MVPNRVKRLVYFWLWRSVCSFLCNDFGNAGKITSKWLMLILELIKAVTQWSCAKTNSKKLRKTVAGCKPATLLNMSSDTGAFLILQNFPE